MYPAQHSCDPSSAGDLRALLKFPSTKNLILCYLKKKMEHEVDKSEDNLNLILAISKKLETMEFVTQSFPI